MAMDETDQTRTPAEEDARAEATVLRWLLALHPILVTFEELLRDVCEEPEDFAERDGLERAVRELSTAGLLHRNGDLLVPTRAALRFDELERIG
jgi:hypothetical protein